MRICLISPYGSLYGALAHFTQSLNKALLRAGVSTEIYLDNPHLSVQQKVKEITDLQADATFCFNSLLRVGKEGEFLSEITGIPHIAYLVDAPHQYIPLQPCEKNKIFCVDEDDIPFYSEELGLKNAYFFPHAVDEADCSKSSEMREIDVLFLGTAFDYEQMRKEWRKRELPSFNRHLDRLIERASEERHTSYRQIIREEVGNIDFYTLQRLWYCLDLYIRGRDRVEVLRAIKGLNVHVYGDPLHTVEWSQLILDSSHIHWHRGVSFQEALALMREARVIVNSFPTFKGGGHERIFAGMASGALLFTNENAFIRRNFIEGKELELFDPLNLEALQERIEAYLSNDEQRESVSEAGRLAIQRSHTWDHYVPKLLGALS